tara:strand:+ start:1536 stop:1640 length:105 start_codon:yes stop_codon:yes gene_type:complete
MNIKNYHDLLKWFRELANWEKKATMELLNKIMEE